MFGMAVTRPSLTVQLTSGMDIFVHECGKRRTLRATIVTILSHIARKKFQFLSNVTHIFTWFF